MSERVRRGFVVAAVTAVLLTVAPATSQAAGLRERVTLESFLERAWKHVAALWPALQEAEASRRWEKEGAMINPDGQPIVPTVLKPICSILNGHGPD